jgi:hypothetical protein
MPFVRITPEHNRVYRSSVAAKGFLTKVSVAVPADRATEG